MTDKEACYVSYQEYAMWVEEYQDRGLEEWRIARWIVFNMMRLSPYLKEKPRRVEDVVKLPGDMLHKPAFTVDVTDDELEGLKKIGVLKNGTIRENLG